MLISPELNSFFEVQIQGGSTLDFCRIIEYAIEENIITEYFFNANELAIAMWFDDNWFTCIECDWTMPVSDMSSNNDWICEDCSEDS